MKHYNAQPANRDDRLRRMRDRRQNPEYVAAQKAKRDSPEGQTTIRNKRYISRYGVPFSWVLDLLSRQGHKCALCEAALSGIGKKQGEGVLDHCHETGQVRGVLCSGCNLALGGYERIRDKAEAYRSNPPSAALPRPVLE